MKRPSICGVVIRHDEVAIRDATDIVDLFELRLDLIGSRWLETVSLINKPWIATNRLVSEGGMWTGSEVERIGELLRASNAGAKIIDIELSASGLCGLVPHIKNKSECLISYHNTTATPPSDALKRIIGDELKAGADICKVATFAQCFDDNTTVLRLFEGFPGVRLIAMAMGEAGLVSRVNGPLLGSEFAYAAISPGAESAPGQLTVVQLARLYGALAL